MDIFAILDESDFTSADMRAIYAIFAMATREGKLTPSAQDDTFITMLPEELRQVAERARARVLLNLPESGPVLTKIASKAAYRLKRMRLKSEMAMIDHLEKAMVDSGDSEGLRTLITRKQVLLSQRHTIDVATASDIHG